MALVSFAHAIPSVRHSVEHVAELTGADVDFVRDKVGLLQRYVLADDETGISLAHNACEALFEKVPGLRETVDLLIFVTQTPDQRLPQNSAGLCASLGLPNTVASFDISLGCSGYVYAVVTAEGFLKQTGGKNAIVVTCDPYSRIIDPSNKDTNCVFGDAATATFVSVEEDGGKIIATDFGTKGEDGEAICIPEGGAAKPISGELASRLPVSEADDLRLHMKGRAVFNFVNTVVPTSIKKCAEAGSVDLNSIDIFALHQGSVYMLSAMVKRLGIDSEKVVINMGEYGNTVSSSIPLIMSELSEKTSLSGKLVLMSGFGVGLSWSTAIVQF